jgi:predicted protein tyrosine phosphatase
MWAEYIETESSSSLSTNTIFGDAVITVTQTSNDPEQPEQPEQPEPEPWECKLCGRIMRYYTKEEHESDYGHMSLVRPRVYLGAAWNSSNFSELSMAGVTTVISMAAELGRKLFPNELRYKHIALEDDEREFILPMLVDVVEFMVNTLTTSPSKECILVHCLMGKSRSVAAIAAWLMYAENIGCREALLQIRNCRAVANTNDGYRHQLLALEILLHNLPLPAVILSASFLSRHYNIDHLAL